ncbi:BMC domain-containing protein [Clostridioides difficile]|nr:BMC domain-containing protein [Clostridioides difficile]
MDAIGLIEVIGYIAAIEASDACLKSANVNLVRIDKVGAGIVTLTICGDVGAVKSALEAGEMAVSRIGTLRVSHIIPRIHNEVIDALFKKEESKICEVLEKTDKNFENILEIDNVILDNAENNDNEKQDNNINKVKNEIKTVDDSLTETNEEKIENSNTNKEVLEQVNIENTDFYKDDLSKNSVKKLKAIAKKLDSSITYKDLNILKKEELINLVKKLSRGDR